MLSGILSPGDEVRTTSSVLPCRVEALLGAGGQGEVYRTDVGGAHVALKWYYEHTATKDQFSALETLIDSGTPDERFLWPMEIVTAHSKQGFGYLMPLREPRFKGISDLLTRRISPSFRSLATAGIQLSDSFLQLHSKGLCYRDISHGNVFFDPDAGDVLICDNDNVGLEGVTGGTLGTPRFMAPEVVRGESLPSTRTDLFSLAVLLFLMLMNHHPLEGRKEAEIRCFDLPAMTRLYGSNPKFIFDQSDDSNSPLPGYQDNALVFWSVYPSFIKDLFTRSFTEGISNPQHGRVRESTWRSGISRLRDSILYCRCGAENFYDADALKAVGSSGTCWKCSLPIQLPPRIRIGKTTVMLNYDTKLYRHHLDNTAPIDFTMPLAEVTRHPKDPNMWGLKNLGDERWTAMAPDGSAFDVDPGKSIPLRSKTRVFFGPADGEIRL
jgi:DNA-binding helix-hairpin-helix protein with protein kinase domain